MRLGEIQNRVQILCVRLNWMIINENRKWNLQSRKVGSRKIKKIISRKKFEKFLSVQTDHRISTQLEGGSGWEDDTAVTEHMSKSGYLSYLVDGGVVSVLRNFYIVQLWKKFLAVLREWSEKTSHPSLVDFFPLTDI